MQAGNESLPRSATGTAYGWRIVRPVAAALLRVAKRITGAVGRSCQRRALAALSDHQLQDMGLTRAEVIAQYLKRGRPILVEGRLKLDQWDDKQTGQKRSRLGVILEGFQFLDSGNRGEGGGSEAPRSRPAGAAQPQPSPTNGPDSGPPAPEEDDVPF